MIRRAESIEQLHALAAKGHIILMITHDLECALATCSRALVIRNGTDRIASSDDTAEDKSRGPLGLVRSSSFRV